MSFLKITQLSLGDSKLEKVIEVVVHIEHKHSCFVLMPSWAYLHYTIFHVDRKNMASIVYTFNHNANLTQLLYKQEEEEEDENSLFNESKH